MPAATRSRIFSSLLTKTKVDTISLDFYHYPKLFEEASKKSYDQKIGLGLHRQPEH